MKFCIYQSPGGTESAGQFYEWMDTDESMGYVRLSEIVEVEFKRLPHRDTIERQLRQLDTKERELRNKFQQALDTINGNRQNLLALPNLSEAQS